jgi:hypothetical protein
VNGRPIPPLLQLWRVVKILDAPALIVGCLAASAGHRWGAYLLIVNVAVQMGAHLAVGTWAYHDVMTRPWPNVPPLDDEDWDG